MRDSPHRSCLGGAALMAMVGMVPPASAERWRIEPGVDAQITATSNSSFGTADIARPGAERDTVVEIKPRVAFRGEGANLRINGSLALDGVAYVDRTQDSKILPSGDVNAKLEAVDRFLFVEAGYRAVQTSANPFGVRQSGGSTVNTITTTEQRLSPYIEAMRGDVRYGLRADNSWVREIGAQSAASTTAGYFGRYTAHVERAPKPLGWRLEAQRSYTRYDNDAEDAVGLTQLRAWVDYAISAELMVALRGGQESNNLAGGVQRRGISGFEVKWDPSPRTTLNGFRENRFFGHAWKLAFNHRMPRLAWTINATRDLQTGTQSQFDLPATGNVGSLLDAMYTTRYPDPAQRALVVQQFMARNGLPNALPTALTLLTDRVSIVTRREATASFNGVRNTLALSAYRVRTEDADGVIALPTGTLDGNNVQTGVSVVLSHRLSQLVTLNFTQDWSRIRSIGSALGDETTQHGTDVRANLQLAPRTTGFLGGRYRKIDSTVVIDGQEKAVYLGLAHLF